MHLLNTISVFYQQGIKHVKQPRYCGLPLQAGRTSFAAEKKNMDQM